MTTTSQNQDFTEGLVLFNCARFFDAHEVLEDAWRATARDGAENQAPRRHLQGLIQLAVAFHHESTGNHIGARSLMERALLNLNGADSSFPELDLGRLRTELEEWQKYFAGAVPRPQPPQVTMRNSSR